MTRRMLSIWVPRLAIERWHRALSQSGAPPAPDRPAVLTESSAKGLLITAATPAANRLGIGPGMRLADAKAIRPDLDTATHDKAGDAALLRDMADGMLRFTPWVAENGMDGLMLDITGCAHLQGGEAGLAGAIAQVFARAGFSTRIGIAETVGAAWAAARFGAEPHAIVANGAVREALSPMPIAALRLPQDLARKLTGLGLKRVGQVMTIDRASLMRRFPGAKGAPGLVERLDQMLGQRDEPLSPRAETPDYRVRVTPLDPLVDPAGVQAEFDRLLESLLGLLQADGRGVRHITLRAFRADGPVITLPVGLARASREGRHIARLFAERLDGIDLGFGVDTLMLSAEATEVIVPGQQGLDGQDVVGEALEKLVDRIANRIGPDRIHGLAPQDSHLPERAARRSDALAQGRFAKPPPAPRPLTLFARPEPVDVMAEIPEGPPLSFRWRRILHRVTRASGPERLAPEWWRDLEDATRTRDYYQVEDTGGARYWLYREGLYHDPAPRPDPIWYLHGIFA